MMPVVWNMAELLELEYRQPVHQSSNQSNISRKEIEKPPCGEETEGQESSSRRDHQSSRYPLIQSYQEEKYKGKNPDMRAIIQAGTNKTSMQNE